MASPIRQGSGSPRDFGERVADAIEALPPSTEEVIGWLMAPNRVGRASPSLGFPDLRSHFAHGLNGANAETIQRIRALVRGIGDALVDNDEAALAQFAQLADQFYGLDTQRGKITRALALVKHAAKAIHTDGSAANTLTGSVEQDLIFWLIPCDARAARLTRTFARTTLLGVKRQSRGGEGNYSPEGALERLAARVGMFGATKANAKDIVRSNTKRPKRRPRRATKR